MCKHWMDTCGVNTMKLIVLHFNGQQETLTVQIKIVGPLELQTNRRQWWGLIPWPLLGGNTMGASSRCAGEMWELMCKHYRHLHM